MKLKVLIILLNISHSYADDTTLREIWKSGKYEKREIPQEWIPRSLPERENNIFVFVTKYDIPLQVREFIKVFGMPDRYLVSKNGKDQNYLIYDLPSGESIALYVYAESSSNMGAAVVIDKNGKLLRLIK